MDLRFGVKAQRAAWIETEIANYFFFGYKMVCHCLYRAKWLLLMLEYVY
jgi:hypothetical protein